MKALVKNYIVKIFLLINKLIHKFPFLIRLFDLFMNLHFNKYKEVKLKKNSIFFLNTNFFTRYRNNTFFSKEPETLDWIDNFKENSTLYDIGANISLYSIYAAKTKNCSVNAFEPCFFNTDYLAKNIYKNSLHKNINIFPIVLGDINQLISFNTPNTMSGNALSQANFKSSANSFAAECIYNLPCFTLDIIIKYFKLKQPDYLKIDVDGAELEILKGSKVTLKKVKSILIEVDNSNLLKKDKITEILINNQFKLEFQTKAFHLNTDTQNQIWKKHY